MNVDAQRAFNIRELLDKRVGLFCLFFAACAHAPAALGWGDRGHRIVAAVAYERLVPEVRKAVDGLLQEDRGDRRTEPDFISRSTWADRLLNDRDTPSRSLYNATRLWHFAEIQLHGGTLAKACGGFQPLAPGRLASKGPPRDCIVNKIEQFAGALEDAAVERKEKILALKFLIHLIGDLHQPLNVVDNGDYSGRTVKVHFSRGATDLQQYWGVELVESLFAGPTESDQTAARRFTSSLRPSQVEDMSAGGPRDWALETVNVARMVVYDFSGMVQASDGRRGSTVYASPDYVARAKVVAQDQLTRAGLRLARLLNDIFTSREQVARPPR